MKASDVIKQLGRALPRVTNAFSTTIDVLALTRAANTVTAVTTAPHGLVDGDQVIISGAISPTPVTSITRVDSVATGVTSAPHDLTEGHQTVVEITGADQPEYNGTHMLLSVPNRTSFTFAVEGSPIFPATGNPLLLEDRLSSYNGLFVITKTGSSEFTYQISTLPVSPAGGSPVAHTEIRVSGAISPDRALDAYTQQNLDAMWAFVVVDDSGVNRERAITNDAVASLTGAGSNRLRLIENFSVYIFIPASQSIAGRAERDEMDDVRMLLYKSLLGTVLQSNFVSPRRFMVVPIGDGFFEYTGAVYIHRFTFQTMLDIVTDDMAIIDDNVAFRDFEISSLNDFDEVLTNVTVDLDDDPI